jgi:hypothetical protein
LVTKVLLPASIASSRENLHPEQVCNGVRSGADALVHETREFLEKYADDDDFVMVSVDARNAFNMFSRKKMLDAAREYAPNFVRWINLIYGKQQPPFVIGDHKFPSQERAQQDDPAATLLFSLVIQPLLRKISNTCDLKLNMFYADDSKIGGRILEVHKALNILRDEGPLVQYYLQPTKTLGYGRTMNSAKLAALVRAYPMDMRYQDAGVTILGVPIGDKSYGMQYLDEKFASIDRVLTLIQKMSAICDIRLAFHAHRLCAQACQLFHVLRLTTPAQTLPHLPRFDAAQLRWYKKLNSVRLDTRCTTSLSSPSASGAWFFPTTSIAEPAFAESLIYSAAYRASMPGSRQLEDYAAEAQPVISTFFSRFHVPPQALMAADLAAHPVHTQNQLSQVAQEQRAIDFWRDAEWDFFVEPGQTPLDPLTDNRARKQSLSTLVASFLTATPTSGNFVKPQVWRVVSAPSPSIYDDTILPLYCRQCHSTMDSAGDHANLSCHRAPCGWVSRLEHVKKIFAREGLRAAGLNCALEVPLLIPNCDKRPGDLFVCLEAPSPSDPVPRNTAMDVTIRSSRVAAGRRHAAEKPGGCKRAYLHM